MEVGWELGMKMLCGHQLLVKIGEVAKTNVKGWW